MPPKIKFPKDFWISCIFCKSLLSSKDTEKHNNQCSENNPVKWNENIGDSLVFSSNIAQSESDSVAGRLTALNKTKYYPVIVRHTLFAPAVEYDGEVKELSHCQNDFVYLHPATMQILGLCIGHPAILNSSNALTAWPAQLNNPASIGLSPKSMKLVMKASGDFTTISLLELPHEEAISLTFFSSEKLPFVKNTDFIQYVKKKLNGKYFQLANIVQFPYFGHPCKLVVEQICNNKNNEDSGTPFPEINTLSLSESPLKQMHNKFLRVANKTELQIHCEGEKKKTQVTEIMDLVKVGGLNNQVEIIKEMIWCCLHKPQISSHSVLASPHGVLLYGPTGSGKSLLAQSLAQVYPVHFIHITGSEIWSKYYGQSEAKLSSLFQDAKKRAPAIIFLDDVETLCPRRDSSQQDVERRVTASLLTLLDALVSENQRVFILAATNSAEDLDPALRRPGRLDREVEIGVPSAVSRKEILQCHLCDTHHSLTDCSITHIADSAHGYVGADLAAVCKQAGLFAMRRIPVSETKTRDDDNICICEEDMLQALHIVKPTAMREVTLQVPKVAWSEIGGQSELKYKLKQAIEWPLHYPEAFARLGIRPPKGLLMYGPPGCSKTMIAKALATESNLNFIAIKGPELFSKWVGESEKAVRQVFARARAAAPSIVFFDEVDALTGERGGSGDGDVSDRVLAQLLTEMDGVVSLNDVTVVAATNRPDRMDKALLRPGRLDRIVYVPLPDEKTREEIFSIRLKKMPIEQDVNIEDMVQNTQGYSGAEVVAVCNEAALAAMQENVNTEYVAKRHFELALSVVTPRTSPQLLKLYDNYGQSSGLHSL